jgi:tRNA1(Val) A37 N6-methylase TrmN6
MVINLKLKLKTLATYENELIRAEAHVQFSAKLTSTVTSMKQTLRNRGMFCQVITRREWMVHTHTEAKTDKGEH